MEIITDETIKNDITNFELRIKIVRDKLIALPETAKNWQDRKKLAEKKRILNDEIQHVKKLISIAQEALTDA